LDGSPFQPARQAVGLGVRGRGDRAGTASDAFDRGARQRERRAWCECSVTPRRAWPSLKRGTVPVDEPRAFRQRCPKRTVSTVSSSSIWRAFSFTCTTPPATACRSTGERVPALPRVRHAYGFARGKRSQPRSHWIPFYGWGCQGASLPSTGDRGLDIRRSRNSSENGYRSALRHRRRRVVGPMRGGNRCSGG
jgi:hypothetical protein